MYSLSCFVLHVVVDLYFHLYRNLYQGIQRLYVVNNVYVPIHLYMLY